MLEKESRILVTLIIQVVINVLGDRSRRTLITSPKYK